MYVSSSAPACPHCGRPSKKPRLPIEIAAGLGLAVLCIAAVAWHSRWNDEAASADRGGCTPEAGLARCFLLVLYEASRPATTT